MSMMTSGANAENAMKALQSASVKRLYYLPKDPTSTNTSGTKKNVTLKVTPWKPVLITIDGPAIGTPNVAAKQTYAYISCPQADNCAQGNRIFVSSYNMAMTGNVAVLIPNASEITLTIVYQLLAGSLYIYQ